MKKFFLALGLLLTVYCSPLTVEAHDIPPEILQYLIENPDASEAEFEAWLETQELANQYQIWNEEEQFESFNLPTELVQFLIDNPEANEPEILEFIQATPDLADAGWESVVQKLLAGETDPGSFTINDLALLNSLSQEFDYRLDDAQFSWWQFAVNYVRLGVEHILEGIDHVLFVMVLVLLLPPWKRVLAMVTTFTIAHTVTLLLGGTNILTLSAGIVEPLIALSIAYIAFTSVFLRQKFPWLESQNNRLLTIFVFGLFHGLGFAGVFAEVAPDATRLLPSLLFFNVGVEIGQLIILALWMPVLWLVHRLKWDKFVIPMFAALVSILALSWVWERLFF